MILFCNKHNILSGINILYQWLMTDISSSVSQVGSNYIPARCHPLTTLRSSWFEGEKPVFYYWQCSGIHDSWLITIIILSLIILTAIIFLSSASCHCQFIFIIIYSYSVATDNGLFNLFWYTLLWPLLFQILMPLPIFWSIIIFQWQWPFHCFWYSS